MRSQKIKIIVSHAIFAIGFVSSVLAQFYPELKYFTWISLLISFVYIFLGWYFFKGYSLDIQPIILFLMGYLYSGVFIGAVFAATNWPLSGIFIFFTLIWSLTQGVILWIKRAKIDTPLLIQLWIEAFLLLILSGILFSKM